MLNQKAKNMLTGRAFDIAQIAIVFGGYDKAELVRRLAFAPVRGYKLNATTVLRILDEMKR